MGLFDIKIGARSLAQRKKGVRKNLHVYLHDFLNGLLMLLQTPQSPVVNDEELTQSFNGCELQEGIPHGIDGALVKFFDSLL